MGLKSDIEETKELWTNSSTGFKCIIVMSLFLATGSITSMADVVFGWKGFILDGLEFYRGWFTEPMAAFISSLGLEFKPIGIDYLTITFLMFSAVARCAYVQFGKVYEGLGATEILAYICAPFAVLLVSHAASENPILGSIIFSVSVIIAVAMPLLVKSIKKFIYYLSLGIPIAIVLVLGAINAGLSR